MVVVNKVVKADVVREPIVLKSETKAEKPEEKTTTEPKKKSNKTEG